MLVLLILMIVWPLFGQITVTPSRVVAQAATLTCTITAVGAVCSSSGKQSLIWNPPLNNGADASIGGVAWNGNIVNPTLSMINNEIYWYVSVRPNGGKLSWQSGKFSAFGPPPAPAIITVGTLGKDGVCRPFGTGFRITESVLVSNEPAANCIMP